MVGEIVSRCTAIYTSPESPPDVSRPGKGLDVKFLSSPHRISKYRSQYARLLFPHSASIHAIQLSSILLFLIVVASNLSAVVSDAVIPFYLAAVAGTTVAESFVGLRSDNTKLSIYCVMRTT